MLASLLFHGGVIAFCGASVSDAEPPLPEYEVTIVAIDLPRERPSAKPLEIVRVLVQPAATTETDEREPMDAAVAAVLPPDIAPADWATLAVTEAEVSVVIEPSSDAEAGNVSDASAVVSSPVAVPAQAASLIPVTDVGTGYWLGVRGQIVRHLKYPNVRRGMQVDTNILLRITLDAHGGLVEAMVANAEPSAYTLAARRAVERAAPFDVPGTDVPLTMELPVRFERIQ